MYDSKLSSGLTFRSQITFLALSTVAPILFNISVFNSENEVSAVGQISRYVANALPVSRFLKIGTH